MKKKMIALLAGAMMLAAASSAFAAFTGTTELYMAAYDTITNTELVLDLGTLSANGNGAGFYGLASSGATSFNLSQLGSSATAATTNVAFFGQDVTGIKVFASDDVAGTPQSAFNKAGSFNSAVQSIKNTAGTASNTYVGATSVLGGYNGKMNASAIGSFAQLNDFAASTNGFTTPEVTLASLIAGNSLGIFSFSAAGPVSDGVLQFTAGLTDVAGLETLSLTTAGTAAPTPIPAAAYLLGSGLMGLVGLRRKVRA